MTKIFFEKEFEKDRSAFKKSGHTFFNKSESKNSASIEKQYFREKNHFLRDYRLMIAQFLK